MDLNQRNTKSTSYQSYLTVISTWCTLFAITMSLFCNYTHGGKMYMVRKFVGIDGVLKIFCNYISSTFSFAYCNVKNVKFALSSNNIKISIITCDIDKAYQLNYVVEHCSTFQIINSIWKEVAFVEFSSLDQTCFIYRWYNPIQQLNLPIVIYLKMNTLVLNTFTLIR